MISFIWSSRYPFIAGCGGSENYTAGQIRELQGRGIQCRIICIGHSIQQSQQDFPDITFTQLASAKDLEKLDDTIIFITYPLAIKTRHKSYVILHCPPPTDGVPDPLFNRESFKGKKLIAVSGMGAGLWRKYLKFSVGKIAIVYPFAAPAFSAVERPYQASIDGPLRLLFAGRMIPDKGIYTLMAALHLAALKSLFPSVTVTVAGNNTEDGKIIQLLCQAHPDITVVPAKKDSRVMAQLMAQHDLVVMPTTNIFWRETFGMISVEAQHAGCRVVASRAGGLPETNCGGLLLTSPDNPLSLARSIAKAAGLGPLTDAERRTAAKKFTVEKSVDTLLKTIRLVSSRGAIKVPLHSAVVPFPGLNASQLQLFGNRSRL